MSVAEKSRIYLDYNATAPVIPEAQEAVRLCLADIGNPSSVHSEGRTAHRRLEEARAIVAASVNGRSGDVIFTSGGTEANALALHAQEYDHLIVSAIEHDSVLRNAQASKVRLDLIPVDQTGVVSLDALRELLALRKGKTLVSVMLANNETGVIQPVADIVRLAREADAFIHCDAIQAIGKLPIDLKALGVDTVAMSAHKFGGPPGVGAVVTRPQFSLSPLLRGGGQENRRRAGTQNLPAILGMAAATTHLPQRLADQPRQAALRDHLESKIQIQAKDVIIYGSGTLRLANTSCIGMRYMLAETQVMALDMAGFAVSAGSACSSGKVTVSHVLQAMGAGDKEARQAIRISIGIETSLNDVDQFCNAWCEAYNRAKSLTAA